MAAYQYIIDVDYQRLLDFANGYTIYGQTIVASPVPIIDVGPAISYLGSQGWTLTNVVGQPGRLTYYFNGGTTASTATNANEPYAGHEGEYASPAGENTGTGSLSGYGNVPEYGTGGPTKVETNITGPNA